MNDNSKYMKGQWLMVFMSHGQVFSVSHGGVTMCALRFSWNLFNGTVCNSVRQVADIWAQRPIWLHCFRPCSWSNVLIRWNSAWFGPSRSPFVFHLQSQNCVRTPELFWVHTQNKQLEAREEKICRIWQKAILDYNRRLHLYVVTGKFHEGV